jgi:hypothetical protein
MIVYSTSYSVGLDRRVDPGCRAMEKSTNDAYAQTGKISLMAAIEFVERPQEIINSYSKQTPATIGHRAQY